LALHDRLTHVMDQGLSVPGSVAALYREHQLRLTRLAWLLLGNRHDAEDVVQDVFVRFQRLETSPNDPAAYLHTMVVNAARDKHRRSARDRRLQLQSERIGLDQEQEAVWEAVQRLPAHQREALILRYYVDLSINQIAATLGCSPGTVKSRISRSMQRLRRTLDEYSR
jgi:RNA polymerase sigma-70 factor (sigma-E family)